MTLIKRIAGIFTGIMCITGIISAFTEEPSAPFIILAAVFGILTFLLWRPNAKEKQKKAEKQERLNNKLKTCTMKHINGLPIAENLNCTITLADDRYIFSSGAMNFELEKSKILDICIKTDREIQQQYVSSIGGAIGGAALFGTLGAIIGGRAKKKTVKDETHHFLIITYQSDDIKYIGFEIAFNMASAKIYLEDFKRNCDAPSTHQL